MDHHVDIFHDIIENVGGGKISSDGHREQIPVFFSTGLHLVGFGLGPPRASNLDSASEEKVDDVGADKTCGASDENMAGRRVIVFVRTCYTCECWYSPRSRRHYAIVRCGCGLWHHLAHTPKYPLDVTHALPVMTELEDLQGPLLVPRG